MSHVARLMLASFLVCAGQAAPAQEKTVADVHILFSDLTDLSNVANRCEEDLKNFAKRALDESPSCRQFAHRFGDRFADRATLLAEVTEFTDRSERGDLACDRQCQDMLRKCEEMRIGVTYVLDYMDFVREF